MLKRWIASAVNSTSIGSSGAGDGSSSPFPGAATKKSSRWSSPPAVCTSMNPPAPGPVSGDSVTNDMRTHATAASTAFPPSRSTSAPAWAVSGCPAATTPPMVLTLSRQPGAEGAQIVGCEAGADQVLLDVERGQHVEHQVVRGRVPAREELVDGLLRLAGAEGV